MDTAVDRTRSGPAGAKARHGLTDAKLRDMPPRERAYKVSDGGNGLYVVISPSGSRSFRYPYRFGGRRETLTIGRHEPVARHAQRSHLAYGMDVTLGEARLLLARARVDVSSGRSPELGAGRHRLTAFSRPASGCPFQTQWSVGLVQGCLLCNERRCACSVPTVDSPTGSLHR